MNSTDSTLFVPRCSFKRLGARFTALVSILFAASWGAVSQTLRLVEVSVSNEIGTERTFKLVLANHGSANSADRLKSAAKSDLASKSQKPATERLLNAVPETVEVAHALHFDLGGAPESALLAAWIGSVTERAFFGEQWFSSSFTEFYYPARAPPAA